MTVKYLIDDGDHVLEQMNVSECEVQFYSWDSVTWEQKQLSNDYFRVAIFKPKGSTIKTQPNK